MHFFLVWNFLHSISCMTKSYSFSSEKTPFGPKLDSKRQKNLFTFNMSFLKVDNFNLSSRFYLLLVASALCKVVKKGSLHENSLKCFN